MSTGVKPDLAARRLAGAVVAALAAFGGTALAQQQPGYVTGSGGGAVVNAAGECWRGGSSPQAPCPPAMNRTATAAVGAPAAAAPREQLAQARTGERARTPLGSGAQGGSVPARNQGAGVIEHGYVNSPEGTNYRTAYGQCWRMGYWTPELASDPCDAVARASVPAPVAVAPQPEPAPAPQVRPEPPQQLAQPAPEPRGPMIQKITLETDVLFEFDKAELRDEGRRKLDEIAEGLKDARVDEIVAIGHTDRIGPESYNAKLSERRAGAVKEYLAQKGVSSERIQAEGRGEQDPVTGDDCKSAKGKKLIQCFQPDRRVEIEVFGTREVAASEQAPAAGATGAPGGQPSGSSGSSR